MRRPGRFTKVLLAIMLIGALLPLSGQAYASSEVTILYTVAGNDGTGGTGGDGGPARNAEVTLALKMIFDSGDHLYFADSNENIIRRIDHNTGIITTVAGTGELGFSGDGGPATEAQFNFPFGIDMDEDGNLYVADYDNHRIRKIDNMGIVTTIAGSTEGYSGDGGLATDAQLDHPRDVALHGNDLYIADYDNHSIRKIDLTTGIISTVAGNGSPDYSGDGMLASGASLKEPKGLTIDKDGNLYIADSGNFRIRKVDQAGVIQTVAGGGDSWDDGIPATEAAFQSITNVKLDSSGNLYLMDVFRARKVDKLTGIISTVAGTGVYGCTGEAGIATSVPICVGNGIAIDSNDNLYLSERGRIKATVLREIDYSDATLRGLTLSSGSLSPVWSSATTSYENDVENGIDSMTVTPTADEFNLATITVNGVRVTSGSESSPISLNVGSNPIVIAVTSFDATTTNTYTVDVKRAPSSDAGLSGLSLSNGSLTPAFATGTTDYTVQVEHGVSGMKLTPNVSQENASAEVNGVSVPSGTASADIPLSVGSQNISVVVRAEDGTTTTTYTVTVTRDAPPPSPPVHVASRDASLSGLLLSSGRLSPAFTPGGTSYEVRVASHVNDVTVTPTAGDAGATVTVNGMAVRSGTASGALPLSEGSQTITVKVTAEDGTTVREYDITVVRDVEEIVKPEPPRRPLLNDVFTPVQTIKNNALAALQSASMIPFPDVQPDSWSGQAIEAAKRLGIVQGRTDGKFYGKEAVTRAEFVAMVAKALYLQSPETSVAAFSDALGHWAEDSINALAGVGAIEGVGAGLFKPEQFIARSEMSAILARFMVFSKEVEPLSFPDTIDSWAHTYIGQLASADIARGGGDGRFYPDAVATREQAVVMIVRMLAECENVELPLNGGAVE